MKMRVDKAKDRYYILNHEDGHTPSYGNPKQPKKGGNMSLEQAIIENTAAVKEHNVLLKAFIEATQGTGSVSTAGAATDAGTKGTGAKGTGAKGAGAKGAAAKSKASVTAEVLKAKLVEYKELTDLAAAKKLTKELSGCDSIAEVPEDKRDETFAGIQEAIDAINAKSGSDDDNGGDDDL